MDVAHSLGLGAAWQGLAELPASPIEAGLDSLLADTEDLGSLCLRKPFNGSQYERFLELARER